jgi:alpha-tubulin suppressor-like RCC1 family protein
VDSVEIVMWADNKKRHRLQWKRRAGPAVPPTSVRHSILHGAVRGGIVVTLLGVGLIGSSNRHVQAALPSPSFTQTLAAGEAHTCALLVQGTVQCWGGNSWGQLGNGTFLDSLTPVPVANVSNAVSIASGRRFSCALIDDGTVKCWGDRSVPGTSGTPIVGLTTVVAITAGGDHVCALLANGTVACWGSLQVQLPGAQSDNYGSGVPTVVPGLSGVKTISAGVEFNCALLNDGSTRCWGDNLYSQLGDGQVRGTPSRVPLTVNGLVGTVDISTGYTHACALGSSGTVQCWGNHSGLGGTTDYSSVPVNIVGLSGARTISAGAAKTCAIVSGGTIACWGRDTFGSSVTPTPSVTIVPGLSNVTALAVGAVHSCALVADGTVRCWGYNESGQIGNGVRTSSISPVAVLGIAGATTVAVGESHSCATLSGGSAKCWGFDNFGQLGSGTGLAVYNSPSPVASLSNVALVASGQWHSCALLQAGTVKCWGQNVHGGLGNGTGLDSDIPVDVTGLSGVTSISLGRSDSCALLADKTVSCWGFGYPPAPTQIAGLTNVTTISSGLQQSCAVLADGTVKCWNFQNTPSTIIGLTNVRSVSLGGTHACALLVGGSVRCWGTNTYGELGDGTQTTSYVPVTAIGISGATSVATGEISSCVVLADSTVKCWGDTLFGFAAGGNYQISLIPIAIGGLSNVASLSAGRQQNCALLKDGSVRCYGDNYHGELGDGPWYTTPLSVLGLVGVAQPTGDSPPPPPPLTLTATPASHTVGSHVTLLAGGAGAPGTLVTFKVTAGPDVGFAAIIAADSTGTAEALLLGKATGQDTVVAWLDTNINGVVDASESSGSTTVEWAEVPNSCGSAAVVGVRGSGDNSSGDAYPGRHAIAIAQRLRDVWGLTLFDDDGGGDGVPVIGLAYPAVSVTNRDAIAYKASVDSGVANLQTEISTLRSRCGPDFKILLVGFSQGSHVIQSLLDKLDDQASGGDRSWESIGGVALLASPRFAPEDPAARGTFLADYPAGGVAGGSVIRNRFAPLTRSWCQNNDLVCVARPRNVILTKTHTQGYDDATPTGRPILDDAAGLLAWDVLQQQKSGPHAGAEGSTTLARVGSRNLVRISAAALYSRGAPSTLYKWDFDGDGTVDMTSDMAWTEHRYGVRLLSGPRSVVTRYRIEFADGTFYTGELCVRRSAIGAVGC